MKKLFSLLAFLITFQIFGQEDAFLTILNVGEKVLEIKRTPK
jgi:hypothetical protein